MVLGADATVEYESPAVERVLGYQVEEREGRSALEFIHPDDRDWAEQLLGDVVKTPGAQVSGEFRVRHADGSWRAIEAVGKNLLDDPAVTGLVINYRDITTRKALEDELRHQAFHDSLTGLANRALFADRLGHALARSRRGSNPLAVLFVDLDDFKNINDSLGHGDGDELLVGVAARLRRRPPDRRHDRPDGRRRVRGPRRGSARRGRPARGRRATARHPAAAVRAPRQGAVHPREHRRRGLERARSDGRRSPAQRRRVDVHGQEQRQEPGPGLRAEHARRGARRGSP